MKIEEKEINVVKYDSSYDTGDDKTFAKNVLRAQSILLFILYYGL